MLDHAGLVVTDLARLRRFYDAVASAPGFETIDNGKKAFLLGRSVKEPIPYLWIGTIRPSFWMEGSRAGLNRSHIAFIAPSKGAVDGFYRAALVDGNNIEACVRGLAAR
jgi:hypothetical protein